MTTTDECMEYAQKLADAKTAKDRNEARAELRATISGAITAERDKAFIYYTPQTERLTKENEALRNALQAVIRMELPPGMQTPGAMSRLSAPWPEVAAAVWPGA